MKLEKSLLEALDRYNDINSYVVRLSEQAPPPPPPDASTDVPPAPDGGEAAPPPTTTPSLPDANSLPPTPDQSAAMSAATPPADSTPSDMSGGDVKGLDVTDLVNMTKEIKSKLDSEQKRSEESVHKMDVVFSKLDDLATQIQNMDQIIAKIDDLENKVREMKPVSAEERLNLRSYDSYPFNQKLSDFFEDKAPEMKATGKNDYVLKPEDLDYSKDEIAGSFD